MYRLQIKSFLLKSFSGGEVSPGHDKPHSDRRKGRSSRDSSDGSHSSSSSSSNGSNSSVGSDTTSIRRDSESSIGGRGSDGDSSRGGVFY